MSSIDRELEVRAVTPEDFKENWHWIRPVLDKIAVNQKTRFLAEDIYAAVTAETATAVLPVDGTRHFAIIRELRDAEGTFIWFWVVYATPGISWAGYFRNFMDLLKARGFFRVQFESARPAIGRVAAGQGFYARAVVYEQKFDLG